MARYIDAYLLIKNIADIEDLRTLSTKTIGEAIDQTPTADVVEVKCGEWLNIVYTQRYRCSLCGNEIYFGKDKFCSGCGAKMDGTSKERGGEK